MTRSSITAEDIPEHHRANRPQWLQSLGRFLVRRMGWRVCGQVPDDALLVAAAAPHTSNWDFIIAVCFILAIDLRVNVLMKDSAFLPVLGTLYKKLGFMPVNRQDPAGFVENIAEKMRQQGNTILVVTPEGTRKKVEQWKSGFIRIALASNARIIAVRLDYRLKEITLGRVYTPNENIEDQLAEIKDYYSHVTPRHPEKF